MRYPIILIEDPEFGGYTVDVTDLPGCVTQAESIPEALEMALDAASLWLECQTEDGVPWPAPSKSVTVKEPNILLWIEVKEPHAQAA